MYLARIAAYDKQGPNINAVIALNPNAVSEARALDAERKAGRVRGPLHGIPIVLKDNFNTSRSARPPAARSCSKARFHRPTPSSSGSFATPARSCSARPISSEFASGGGSVTGSKDPAVLKAGQITEGFSSLGGQTRNPHDPARGPGASSGGTGAAVAAVFAQFGLGTDTAGSIRGPAAANGVVGLKTTRGLVSRTGLLPLANYDTVGPIARSVYDVAVVLNVLAGIDPADASTRRSAGRVPADYTQFLKTGSLKGARIGIGRDFTGPDPETIRITEEAIVTLQATRSGDCRPGQFSRPPAADEAAGLYPGPEFGVQSADCRVSADAQAGVSENTRGADRESRGSKDGVSEPGKARGTEVHQRGRARAGRSRVPGREERGLPGGHGRRRSHLREVPAGRPGLPFGKPAGRSSHPADAARAWRQPVRLSVASPLRSSRTRPASRTSSFPRE